MLRGLADRKRARSNQRFFKEPVALLGIDTATLRDVQRDLVRGPAAGWTIRDAVRFCEAMLRDPHLEARALGFGMVARFAGQAPPELLPTLERWLARYCGNWALVDTLAPAVLGPLLDGHRELIPVVLGWTTSPNLWLRRGAVVSFVLLARKGRHLAATYRIATTLFGDREDLIHKAVGWLLREAGKTDMPRLERFLRRHGPRIPRTTLRYAIERFPDPARKALLEATRRRAPLACRYRAMGAVAALPAPDK